MSKRKSWYPVWFPYPSSWLNAFLLALLTGLVIWIAGLIGLVGVSLAEITAVSELFILSGVAVILCPIPTVAIVHHLLQHIFYRISPGLIAPEQGIPKGILPGLMSWWEGLWSWTVMVLSTLVVTAVLSVVARPYITFDIDPDVEKFYGIFSLTWITTAAYLYQISYLVEQRLIKVGREESNRKSR